MPVWLLLPIIGGVGYLGYRGYKYLTASPAEALAERLRAGEVAKVSRPAVSQSPTAPSVQTLQADYLARAARLTK